MYKDYINPPPEANNPYINYNAVEDEIIARAPIESAPGVFCESFKIDSKSVWDHLDDLLWDTKAWVNIKTHQRALNGSAEFISLKGFLSWPRLTGLNTMENPSDVILTPTLGFTWLRIRYCRI